MEEIQSESTPKNLPEGVQLTDMKAVPQILDLPLLNANGEFPSIVNLYPKNTIGTVGFDKTIKGLSSADEAKKSYSIGDIVEFELKVTIPAQSKLSTLVISDTMTEGLTYKNDATMNPALADVVNNGNGFTITFTQAQIDKINNKDNEQVITVSYSATLNEKANITDGEVNTAKIEYGNNPQDTTNKEDKVTVKTFGAKFKKVGAGKIGLENAIFVVKNNVGKYLQEGRTWGDLATAKNFTSGTDGTFEVTGLTEGSYQLEETQAPSDFAKLTAPVNFSVNADSYTKILEIVNNKLIIPVTGCIETIEPSDFSKLLVEKNKDKVTLLTCTPYMINSHRLLVIGERIDYIDNIKKQDIRVAEVQTTYLYLFICILVLFIILLILYLRLY